MEEIWGRGGSETASEGTASAFRSHRRAGASTCVLSRSWGLLLSPVVQLVVESQRKHAHWAAAQHGFERHAAIGNSRSGY